MKWSIVGLVVLGIIAAGCAAVLVAAVRADSRHSPAAGVQPSNEVNVLIAAKDLPAMSVIDTTSVLTKSVPAKEAPANCISNPVSVVGKVLARPILKGQPFTASCFATEGTGLQLAAALPEGMRAVSISLADHASLKGLLYPGSVVDVLASFRLTSRQDELGQAVSIVLLQGIEVLAVEDHTIVSDASQENLPSGRKQYTRNTNVTLMVSPRQAEALQLAASNGALSLAMRNPLDVAATDRRATVLSELSDEFLSRLAKTIQVPASLVSPQPPAALPATQPAVPTAPRPPMMVKPPAPETRLAVAQWQMEVIRGGNKEKHSFPMPRESRRR